MKVRTTGIEHHVWVQAGTSERVFAVANEDLERSTDDKTSAVHFLRFEFDPRNVAAIKAGAEIRFGIEHESLSDDAVPEEVVLSDDSRNNLANDLG